VIVFPHRGSLSFDFLPATHSTDKCLLLKGFIYLHMWDERNESKCFAEYLQCIHEDVDSGIIIWFNTVPCPLWILEVTPRDKIYLAVIKYTYEARRRRDEHVSALNRELIISPTDLTLLTWISAEKPHEMDSCGKQWGHHQRVLLPVIASNSRGKVFAMINIRARFGHLWDDLNMWCL